MREQGPMTQTMKISDVKSKLSSLVNEVYRDKQLLKLRSYQTLTIFSPGELLPRFECEALG